MPSTLAAGVLVLALCLLGVRASVDNDESTSKKYKFLYYTPMVNGSHYFILSNAAKVLVQRGHKVVFLMSEPGSYGQVADSDVFSFVVFNSTYTKQERRDMYRDLATEIMNKPIVDVFDPLFVGIEGNLTGKYSLFGSYSYECDALLGDNATMRRLRLEQFDMLVGDGFAHCNPLIAQALDIPFILHVTVHAVPTKDGYWSGLPVEPSYVPERLLGLTDKMTFFQRAQNYLGYIYNGFLHSQSFHAYDELKMKYNIKPELSTFDSNKQASLYLIAGSFGLEFPRPMQPNTVYVLHSVGLDSNKTLEDNVAKFLDTAPNGAVLFSLGTYLRFLDRAQAQLFADGLAMLPHRVLWQTKNDLPAGVKLGKNTKVVKWIPLQKVLEHTNVRVYISHVGGPSMYEALWAGLPIVGIPFFEDQPDNMIRVVDRGAGILLHAAKLTPDTLSGAISLVINDPKFRRNAQRISMILRDLYSSSPPAETVARWILHVTRFGGDHLRPAVQYLNYVQRNLLDVYMFISAVLALIIGLNVSVCFCCCKCMCRGGRKSHIKKE